MGKSDAPRILDQGLSVHEFDIPMAGSADYYIAMEHKQMLRRNNTGRDIGSDRLMFFGLEDCLGW
jgi:hypothetical protein